jgi:hypothetical protein
MRISKNSWYEESNGRVISNKKNENDIHYDEGKYRFG